MDNSLHKTLFAAKIQKGKEIRIQLKGPGILNSNGSEIFKGYLTFPIQNQHGETIEIYGRRAKDVIQKFKHQ